MINVIISGLDPLGLVSFTGEALLSATTWLAVHKMRTQIISEQIRTSDGMMHSGFESRKMSQDMMNDSRVINLDVLLLHHPLLDSLTLTVLALSSLSTA